MSMISAILPVRNEENTLKQLHPILKEILGQFGDTFEIIYVNDGSTDDSLNILRSIKNSDPRMKIINLDRSYGQANALQAGIDNAGGDIIITIDADLENDPRDIGLLLRKLNEGYDVVCGKRVGRPFGRHAILSAFGNVIFKAFFGAPVDDMACTLRVYKKTALEKIVLRGSMHRYIPVLLFMKGAKITQMDIRYNKRKWGRSKYRTIPRIISTLKDIFNLIFLRSRILNNTQRDYKIKEML